MSFSNVTGRYYQNESDEYPKSISYPQLFVLHVAAHYKLRRSSMGWWADGDNWLDRVVRIHSSPTVKSLVKAGLLEGNTRGEKIALKIPMLWTSEKGRTLLEKITVETGLVFDKVNYQLMVPGQGSVCNVNFKGEYK